MESVSKRRMKRSGAQTRRPGTILALALPLMILSRSASGQMPETSPAHQTLNAKCTRCHSSDRVLKANPGQLQGIVDRMELKNPEFFRDTDKAALIESLSKILNDPKVAAGRAAWDESVARGMAAFNDTSLGTNGKSCSSCHQPEDLKGAGERHPKFDAKLGRLVSLQERLRVMIETKLDGKAPPLGDGRMVDLEAYITSLR